MKAGSITEHDFWRGTVDSEREIGRARLIGTNAGNFKPYLVQKDDKFVLADPADEKIDNQTTRRFIELHDRLAELELSEARHRRIAEELKHANRRCLDARSSISVSHHRT